MKKNSVLIILMLALSTPYVRALGIVDGKLSSCGYAWNCAITQEVDGKKPNAQPIYYSGSRKEALDLLKETILSFNRVNIIIEASNYLHVEFTTKRFNFVDDVEFFFPANEKVIHMRSASRKGWYDFGVNKKRVHAIAQRFKELDTAIQS